MEQTVLQIGNSAGVVIPNSLRQKLGLKKGSKVVVDISVDGESLVIYKAGKLSKVSSITPKFLETLKGVNSRYGEVLAKLAKY